IIGLLDARSSLRPPHLDDAAPAPVDPRWSGGFPASRASRDRAASRNPFDRAWYRAKPRAPGARAPAPRRHSTARSRAEGCERADSQPRWRDAPRPIAVGDRLRPAVAECAGLAGRNSIRADTIGTTPGACVGGLPGLRALARRG